VACFYLFINDWLEENKLRLKMKAGDVNLTGIKDPDTEIKKWKNPKFE
jgi:hypothetical protein